MKTKLGQEQMFANEFKDGSSKRFYAACAAMQGLLGNGKYSDTELDNTIPSFIKLCYKCADELLRQEGEE